MTDYFDKQQEKSARMAAMKTIPANDFLGMEAKEQPFLLDRMLVENSINALTADSGKGKSLIMLKMAEAIVRGEPFLGKYAVKKTNVLVVDVEMSENDLISRVKTIIQSPIEGLDFYALNEFDIENDACFEWLCQQIESKQYGLIVFDTLSGIHSRNENDNSEMAKVNKKFIELANKHKTTILFLHHHRKAKSDEHYSQGSARGAGSIIDKAASHLIIDSKDSPMIYDNRQVAGLKATIQQEKRRQIEGLNRFAVDIYHEPVEKKTYFMFSGEQEERENAIDRARVAILAKMEDGQEYVRKDFEGCGSDKNVREALTLLLSAKAITIRQPAKDERTLNGKPIAWNVSIYAKTNAIFENGWQVN